MKAQQSKPKKIMHSEDVKDGCFQIMLTSLLISKDIFLRYKSQFYIVLRLKSLAIRTFRLIYMLNIRGKQADINAADS